MITTLVFEAEHADHLFQADIRCFTDGSWQGQAYHDKAKSAGLNDLENRWSAALPSKSDPWGWSAILQFQPGGNLAL